MARSTISMARSTPAQKPRGLARRISIFPSVLDARPWTMPRPDTHVWPFDRARAVLALDHRSHPRGLFYSASASLHEHTVQDQHDGAHGDGGIRHVEGRVEPVLPMELQEIHHVAMHQPVPHVTHGTTGHQRHAYGDPAVAV